MLTKKITNQLKYLGSLCREEHAEDEQRRLQKTYGFHGIPNTPPDGFHGTHKSIDITNTGMDSKRVKLLATDRANSLP